MKNVLILGGALWAFLPAAGSASPVVTVLYNFQAANDGGHPTTGIIADKAGNLYGATEYGQDGSFFQDGLIYKLAPPQSGSGPWTESAFHIFKDGLGGAQPYATLLADSAGNFYGTARVGGAYHNGTVFKLTRPTPPRKVWLETTLYAFHGTVDGGTPIGGLAADSAGNLYGTTSYGGVSPLGGTVFRLSPPTSGNTAWTYSRLHSFTVGMESAQPISDLIADSAGNLYGTTQGYGATDYGGVFRLAPPKPGKTGWTETPLYAFKGGNDGEYPYTSRLIADSAGNLYGTTIGTFNWNGYDNSTDYYGTVYELSPPAAGATAWTKTTIHLFTSGSDGAYPVGGLIADSAGNFYGTTYDGGGKGDCVATPTHLVGCGTVFKLAPPAAGQTAWTETVLYAFDGKQDGAFPVYGLIADKAGNLYGPAGQGAFGYGEVFKLTASGFVP